MFLQQQSSQLHARLSQMFRKFSLQREQTPWVQKEVSSNSESYLLTYSYIIFPPISFHSLSLWRQKVQQQVIMSSLIFAVQYRHGGLILLNLPHCQNYFSLPPFSHTSMTHSVLVSISLITALLHLDKQPHKNQSSLSPNSAESIGPSSL